MLIDVECGNLKIFVDGGELTRNINQVRNQMFQKLLCDKCSFNDKCYRQEYLLSKHEAYYELVTQV